MTNFLVWHQGPDDIHAVGTWLEAVDLANQLNRGYAEWATERTAEAGRVLTTAWAVPYSLERYRAETGHQIDLSADVGVTDD